MVDGGWYNIFVITVDTDNPESMKKIEPCEGVFSVYITASKDLMNIIHNYDMHFSVNRDIVYENSGAKLLSKISEGANFYTLNVLVKKDEKLTSIFDYQFDSLELNEERTVKYLWDLDYAVARLICNLDQTDIVKKYITEFVKAKEEGHYICELTHMYNNNFSNYGTKESIEVWQNAWNELYTDKAILLDENQNLEACRIAVVNRGYKPIVVRNKTAYNLLSSMKIKSMFDILGEQVDYNIDDDISSYSRLLEAIEIASHFEPGLIPLKQKIGVFESKKEGLLGKCVTVEDNDKRIIIEKHHAKRGSVQELVGTLIHEFDHYSTNICDSADMMGREFRDIADTRIGQLMVDYYKQEVLEKRYGGAYIAISKMSTMSNFNYNSEYSELLGQTILCIGGMNFIIECGQTAIEESGTCSVDKSGNYLYVPINGEFEIMKEVL